MTFDFPFLKEAVTQLFQKSSCEEYPFKPKEAFEGYRGKIVFHGDLCIKCGMCEKVCAGGAIENVLIGNDEEGNEIYERSFDLTSCTFCRMCSDFCAKKAIELSPDFHMAVTKHEDLIVKGTYVKKKPAPKAPKAAPAAPKAEAPAEA